MTTKISLLARGFSLASFVLAASTLIADTPNTPTRSDKTIPQTTAAASTVVRDLDQQNSSSTADQQSEQQAKPCHWWQFRRCDDTTDQTEGLPPDAPRTGTVITVDVTTNRLFLFQDGKLVDRSLAATGTGKVLKKGRKVWAFHTPRGHLKVLRKIEDPVWTKPDWAFVEAGEKIPPPDSPKRLVKGHLGKYALDLGDGIMIHGTDEIDSIGRKASHGCIRLPGDMLETVWKNAKVGTDVYIYESQPQQQAATKPGQPERHSDLD